MVHRGKPTVPGAMPGCVAGISKIPSDPDMRRRKFDPGGGIRRKRYSIPSDDRPEESRAM